MSTSNLAPYIHREVPLEFGGRRLTFATSLDLFSSHQVDVGTRLLLRTLEPLLTDGSPRGEREGARILDLGCGYGALGVALATLPGVAAARLVDRDALALEFARANAARNGVEGRVTVTASLGLDDVPAERGYDVVACNVPGKAGEAVIAAMLVGALGVLRPGGPISGGLVAIVVIEPIREFVAATLARAGLRERIEVTLRRDTADYSVFHYRPAPGVAFPAPTDGFAAGVYDRDTLAFEDVRGEPVSLPTVHGLPGYDRPGPLEIAVTRRLPEVKAEARVLVTNVGQGYLSVYLWRAQPAARFLLVDRDLLALRTARRALLSLRCAEDRIETRHVGTWGASGADRAADARGDLADLIVGVGVLHEAEYAGLVGALAPGGRAVLAGSSTAVTRLLARPLPAGMTATRTRHRGISILEVATPRM